MPGVVDTLPTLLLLDNFEQVVTAAPLLTALLDELSAPEDARDQPLTAQSLRQSMIIPCRLC